MLTDIFYLVGVFILIMEVIELFNTRDIINKMEYLEKWDEDNPGVKYEDKPKMYRDYVQSRSLYTWVFLIWPIVGLFTIYFIDFTIFFILTILIYPNLSTRLRGKPERFLVSILDSLFVIGFIIFEIIKHYH